MWFRNTFLIAFWRQKVEQIKVEWSFGAEVELGRRQQRRTKVKLRWIRSAEGVGSDTSESK
jgi:hypothetical protein